MKARFLNYRVFLPLLFFLWLAQMGFVIYQGDWGWRVLLRDWWKPLVWRSARFAHGPKVADRIMALRAAIPPRALVVLPPDVTPLGRRVYERELEWFLFPRKLTNCLTTACLQEKIAAGRAFVVWLPGAFPRDAVAPDRWRSLGEDLALVAPNAALARYWQPDPPLTLARWVLEALAALLLQTLMAWGGWGLLRWSGRGLGHPLLEAAAAWALGSGSMTLGVYVLLLLGLPLRVAVVVVAALLAVLGWRAWRNRTREGTPALASIPRRAWVGFLFLAAWVGLLAGFAVGKGYHEGDALSIWGIKGYGIAVLGMREGTYRGLVRDYPLHVPLLIAFPKALWDDATGMSKIVFPLFLLGIVTLLYWEGYRLSKRVGWAFLGAGLWATAPLVVRHGQIAYANLGAAFYLLWGVWLAVMYRRFWLAGLLLAWVVWVRPEGWLLVAAVLPAMTLGLRDLRALRGAALPPVLMFALWLLTRRIAYAYRYAPGILKTFLPGVQALLQGQVVWEAWGAVLRAWRLLLDPEVWGLLGIFILLGLPALARMRQGEVARGLRTLALAGFAALLAVSGIYYFTAYLPESNVAWWLATGFDRMNLPTMALLWSAAWLGAGRWLQGESSGED